MYGVDVWVQLDRWGNIHTMGADGERNEMRRLSNTEMAQFNLQACIAVKRDHMTTCNGDSATERDSDDE
jgi:hypothetical protein